MSPSLAFAGSDVGLIATDSLPTGGRTPDGGAVVVVVAGVVVVVGGSVVVVGATVVVGASVVVLGSTVVVGASVVVVVDPPPGVVSGTQAAMIPQNATAVMSRADLCRRVEMTDIGGSPSTPLAPGEQFSEC
jgi:hypothetical protein